MQLDEDSLMEAIAKYFKPEKEITYQRSEPGGRQRFISGIASGDKATWFFKFEIRPTKRGDLLFIAASSSIKLPESNHANVDELLKQINSFYSEDFELDAGNPEFEFDFPSGMVTCTGWIELKDALLNDDNFALLLEKCITMEEEYFDAIMAVGFGGIDPSVAMEKLRNEKDTAKIMH